MFKKRQSSSLQKQGFIRWKWATIARCKTIWIEEHKSHCLTSPPQQMVLCKMTFGLLQNTHEWNLSGEFGVPRFKASQLEKKLVN